MTRTTWILPVAVVLATALAQPVAAAEPAPAPAGAPAEPEPGATEPRYATVEIDTSDIGEEGPVIKRRSRERTDVVLRAAGVLPGRPDAGDPVIRIDVDELSGPDPGYLCEVWIDHRGEVLGERRRVECTLCTESEIVQRVEATVTELGGHKGLYSESFYDEATFHDLYGGAAYRPVKERYDPSGRFPTLYDKAVRAR